MKPRAQVILSSFQDSLGSHPAAADEPYGEVALIQRTFLEFRSRASFSTGDDLTPGGMDLANFVAQSLRGGAIETTDASQEDWGAGFYAVIGDIRVLVGCGHYAEYEDGWLVFVEPSKSSLSYWISRKRVNDVSQKVAREILRVLLEDGRQYEARWWTDKSGLGPTIEANLN